MKIIGFISHNHWVSAVIGDHNESHLGFGLDDQYSNWLENQLDDCSVIIIGFELIVTIYISCEMRYEKEFLLLQEM